jgi:sterol desaturase/sphingolipid hydroxylase (fatty acid hydroxylase superfamily)
MTSDTLGSSLAAVGLIVGAMMVVAFVEVVLPLHTRSRRHREHLGPNLALTVLAFGTNVAFNVALVAMLFRVQATYGGILQSLALPPLASAAVAVVLLDFSFYVAHRIMHRSPTGWRFHAVHHSDPAVDVTTTIRQHPGESAIRYGFLAVAAVALGSTPGAFAVYRLWSALNGLLEHANVRVPQRLDAVLSLVVSTPNMHKVHHSRRKAETNSNYGNIFAIFDRLCGTFTPSARGTRVVYGLDGFDDPAVQSTVGLLALPFRGHRAPSGMATVLRNTAA